jgi:hypothetical protein
MRTNIILYPVLMLGYNWNSDINSGSGGIVLPIKPENNRTSVSSGGNFVGMTQLSVGGMVVPV